MQGFHILQSQLTDIHVGIVERSCLYGEAMSTREEMKSYVWPQTAFILKAVSSSHKLQWAVPYRKETEAANSLGRKHEK